MTPALDAELNGCVAKIERGKEHLEALQSEIGSFLEGKPYSIVSDFKSQPGYCVFRARVNATHPIRWSMLIGDFVHNIRSALDHLVWALALSNRNGDESAILRPKGVGFPISTDAGDFDRRGRPMIADLSSGHAAAIERLQPYHADDAERHALAVLNDLWNTDKHRTIHLVNMVIGDQHRSPSVSEVFFENARPIGPIELSLFDGPLVDGAQLGRVPFVTPGPKAKVGMEGKFSFDVAFENGLSVQDTLELLGRGARDIILDFEEGLIER